MIKLIIYRVTARTKKIWRHHKNRLATKYDKTHSEHLYNEAEFAIKTQRTHIVSQRNNREKPLSVLIETWGFEYINYSKVDNTTQWIKYSSKHFPDSHDINYS